MGDHGYTVIRFRGKLYLAHRLAWFYMTGEWPREQIDHKDGVRLNNKWDNLREATPGQNNMNRTAIGVHKRQRKGRPGWWYCGHIEKDGKRYSCTYRDEGKAIAWRKQKEIELFGEFRKGGI